MPLDPERQTPNRQPGDHPHRLNSPPDEQESLLFGWVGALRRSDPDLIASRLADDVVWQGLRADLVCPNRDAVLDNIRAGGQHRRRVGGLEVAALDDGHVLFAVRLPGVTELYGEPIAGELFRVFTLRGEVIVRIDEFKTRDEALDSVRTAIAPDETGQSDRLEPASTPVAAQRAMVERVVPILNVSDIRESFAWFGRLGWRKGFEWNPEGSAAEPGFGSVESGECEIFLCRDGQGGRGRGTNALTFGPEGNEAADHGTWMSIWVEDLDAIYRKCVTERLDITYPPTDEPWGVREFHVRHPDGHVFRIGKAR
jgi:catechol 2,3-dioxygenase-like lactoylglutathione lyase family enzyme